MTAVLGIPPPGPVWRCEPAADLDDLAALIRVWLTQQETPMAEKPLTDREKELDEAAEKRVAAQVAEERQRRHAGEDPGSPFDTSLRWD